ncbi:MAG: TolC family protein [Hyphomicrobiaceae bacterium]
MAAIGTVIVLAGLSAGCAIEPDMLTETEISARISGDVAVMWAEQEPIAAPIDLYTAVARGLKYNLDKRLKDMESALASRALEQSGTRLLPEVVASAGYRGRDDYRGSSSRSLITGRQSLEVSTSEDKHLRTADLQMVWNLLDFGLTYLRAREDADQVLIAEERRIKVAQNIILDIRDAWWRAVAAERMLPGLGRLISEIERAVGRSAAVVASGSGEPSDELKLQRLLLETLRDLKEVRRRLSLARSELAALMNVAPGTDFMIAMPAMRRLTVPQVAASIEDLEMAALAGRPELREEDLKKRISLTEVRAAYVRLLPGIELRLGTNYDSNSFLYEPTWQNAAGLLTKNLMEIATAGSSIGFAEQGVVVADARRQSLSMAVIAQLHLSLERLALATDVYRSAERLYDVDRRLADVAAHGSETTAGSAAEALTALSRKAVSELQYYSAYADLQNAYGRVLNSVGAHRLSADIESLDVASLAAELRPILDEWRPPSEMSALASIDAEGAQ